MFATATSVIPTGSGATLVSTVAGQLSADMPELLIIFGGLVAIGVVLKLLRKYGRSVAH